MNNKLELFKKLIYRAGYREQRNGHFTGSFVDKYINKLDENLLLSWRSFLILKMKQF